MKPKMFEELLESVREGGAIVRGQRKASRRFAIAPLGFGRRGSEPIARAFAKPGPPPGVGLPDRKFPTK